MNYRRQSVVGFNMDFLGYDLAGFISFTMYNCLIFWSPAVFSLYLSVYPGASNPIQINDVFFCLHAVFIQVREKMSDAFIVRAQGSPEPNH